MPAALTRRAALAASASLASALPAAAIAGAPATAGVPLAAPSRAAGLVAAEDLQLLALLGTATEAWAADQQLVGAASDARAAGDRAGEQAAVAHADAAFAAYADALAAMEEIPAAGLVGLAAKLSVGALFVKGADLDCEASLLASGAEDAARILAGLALPGAAPLPLPGADAELLDLAEQWDAISVELAEAREAEDALPPADPQRDGFFAATRAPSERRRRVLNAIAARPARTAAGRRAKAEILIGYLEGSDDPVGVLAASICRDLVGGVA